MSTLTLDETVRITTLEMGRRLRARRLELGRTVAAVAMDAGLSLPYVANLENGRGNPTIDTLVRLAQALDLSLGSVVDSAEPSRPASAPLPTSLVQFARTAAFGETCDRLAKAQKVDEGQMRAALVALLAACPDPRTRPHSSRDWRRLLDAVTLILIT